MYFIINDRELSALRGLSYLQQITYLTGIRPYMDRSTLLVGVKRRISYQSLAEALYIEPVPGVPSKGSPGRQQLRRALKSLEQQGLICSQSVGKQLIVKCLLATGNKCVQNQADTRPTLQGDTKGTGKKLIISDSYVHTGSQGNPANTPQADTPHESVNNFVCVSKNFEIFWTTYPQQEGKQNALMAFNALSPGEHLFSKMMAALKNQIKHRAMLQAAGQWIPHWKYPANWLAQQCWKDELPQIESKERNHAKDSGYHAKKLAVDILWQSCEGAQFDFDIEEENLNSKKDNIIQFSNSRSQ